jgi:hypothetical protein
MSKYNDLCSKIERFEKLAAAQARLRKLSRKKDDLAMLKANIGNYIHFSNSDRLGIHYSGELYPGNPKAVYGFPLTAGKYALIENNKPRLFDPFGDEKYIYVFSVSGNILNMDAPNLEEIAHKVRDFVRGRKGKSYHILYVPQPLPYASPGATLLEWLNQVAEEIFKDRSGGVNVLLRGIGYDAMETHRNGFGDGISSEIAVLNPSAVNLIAKLNNPLRTKEIDQEIRELEQENGGV